MKLDDDDERVVIGVGVNLLKLTIGVFVVEILIIFYFLNRFFFLLSSSCNLIQYVQFVLVFLILFNIFDAWSKLHLYFGFSIKHDCNKLTNSNEYILIIACISNSILWNL